MTSHSPEFFSQIRGISTNILNDLIVGAIDRILDDLDRNKIPPEWSIEEWVDDYTQNHLWDI